MALRSRASWGDWGYAAGWQVVRVRRPGEPHATGDSTYPEVAEMTEIRLA